MSSKTAHPIRALGLFALLASALTVTAADNAPASASTKPAVALAPLPPPMNVPKPGPRTDGPYQPQTILAGGVVLTLFPPDSPYLKQERLREPEVYTMGAPGQIATIVGIHNPSIEFHPGKRELNTGVAVILAGGGGHNSLNVGTDGGDFVSFFYQHGVNTVILRNRLARDGYNPRTDEVYDALQAIKLVRAHAKDWALDPHKIGIMGFSAGAELAAAAAIQWAEFDQKNNVPENPLAGVSSRPDFAGLLWPGPTPFTPRGGPAVANWTPPTIPRDMPPSFIAGAGWGDRSAANNASDWFSAMIRAGVPNVEMHIYARGHHPGAPVGPDEPPSTGGLSNRGFIALGTWPLRFIEWFRDLGFLNKPGVETQAAKDVAANVSRAVPPAGGARGSNPAPAAPAPANAR
jgi:acetyl esterase/lipase